MRPSTKIYTITEYGGFVRGKEPLLGYQPLPDKAFDALETFILANSSRSETETLDLLSLSARRGIGKIITARNYVGLITMHDGTVIEILPKVHNSNIGLADTRRIFLEMLKTLKDVVFKDFNISDLNTDRLSLFEIFITMFVNEVTLLKKQGLKSSYTPVEANERFFKGKLIVAQDIKNNLVCREHFFVRYDEFSIDRPENRLIKSTLRYLLMHTHDERNRLALSRLLAFFDGVAFSADYAADLTRCVTDRNMSHYEKILLWCKIFLRGNSFTAFAGSEVAIALLFPMEKVFESFIAAKLRRHITDGFEIRTQDARYSLFDHPTRAFALRPDIVLSRGKQTVVMDTKWKLLADNVRNYGISQSDMYQMYAYGKKYDAANIVLLYPLPGSLLDREISFKSDDGVTVNVAFIDLLQPDASVSRLLSDVSGTRAV
jgi:5-methylcytosine-specific restriction enzyme subunit McrC